MLRYFNNDGEIVEEEDDSFCYYECRFFTIMMRMQMICHVHGFEYYLTRMMPMPMITMQVRAVHRD